MVFINAPFIMFNHVSLFDTCVKAATPRRPRHHQMCRNCQGVGLSVLSKHGDLSEKASKSVFKRKEDVCTACRTGTCLGRDSCHALLGPHTVALSANSDTCGDEDMPQAQGGDDASTEPPHSHVSRGRAVVLGQDHSRSTQEPRTRRLADVATLAAHCGLAQRFTRRYTQPVDYSAVEPGVHLATLVQ